MTALPIITLVMLQVIQCLVGSSTISMSSMLQHKLAVIPTLKGTFKQSNAAFSSIVRGVNSGTSPKWDLILTSFSMFHSEVSIVNDIAGHFDDLSSAVPKTLTTNVKWPNEVSGVPIDVFNQTSPRYIAIPDGFLVPFHGKGALSLMDTDADTPVMKPLTSGHETWFYHRVRWIDMDKDGRLDALTCRGNVPMIFGTAKGQLLWLSNPVGGSIDTPWKENILASGPDVFFEINELKVGGKTYEVIVTVEYFHPRLRIFWTEDPHQNWANTDAVKYRDIDNVTGLDNPFAILFKDLNADGNNDILVSFNSPTNGTVFAYEIPEDFKTGNFKRHLLADGYKPKTSGQGKGAPGGVYVVDTPNKPVILVSGDDSAVATMLTPKNETDPSDWSYDRMDFLEAGKSTIGGLTVTDVDDDGTPELFVPSYDEGLLYVYSLDKYENHL